MARRCAKLATMAIRARLKAAAVRRSHGSRRFGLLLAVLVSTYVLSAFLSGSVIRIVQIVLFLAVVMIAVRASRVTRRVTRLVNAVVLAGTAAALALQAAAASPMAGAASLWIALLLLLAVILILREVLMGKEVTLQSIFGAISAYLVIGLMFAASYAAISRFGGSRFFANGQPGNTATFQYFSFTTLTTVGYGDFTAASAGGRAVAVMEAVLGQVFLAVLVGWLVSAFRAPRFAQDDPGAAPHVPAAARHNRAVMSAAVRRSSRSRSARPRPGAPARLTRRG